MFSIRQINDMIFAFLVHKIALREARSDLDVFITEPSLHRVFPDGLHGYFIEHGWPRVPFKYKQPDNLITIAMDELSLGYERDFLGHAAKLIFVLFGRSDLPGHLESLAYSYLRQEGERFKLFRQEADGIFADRSLKEYWGEHASDTSVIAIKPREQVTLWGTMRRCFRSPNSEQTLANGAFLLANDTKEVFGI